ncbi:MAG: SIS domain-containing protein [Longimicrobiales bacterium]|nr:SIS domain-containing protein [Longimicrobiales bacterium]
MNDATLTIRDHLTSLADLSVLVSDEMSEDIAALAALVLSTVEAGGKIMFCGNGGSAANAQHLATEYVVRFARERRAVAALALTTDTSLLTAGANDYGFDTIFSRQIEALGRPGDILVLHSTSGDSENLIAAVEAAKVLDIRTVALLAKGGGRLKSVVDQALVVPTQSTARAQELHLAIGHIVCEIVDKAVAGDS